MNLTRLIVDSNNLAFIRQFHGTFGGKYDLSVALGELAVCAFHKRKIKLMWNIVNDFGYEEAVMKALMIMTGQDTYNALNELYKRKPDLVHRFALTCLWEFLQDNKHVTDSYGEERHRTPYGVRFMRKLVKIILEKKTPQEELPLVRTIFRWIGDKILYSSYERYCGMYELIELLVPHVPLGYEWDLRNMTNLQNTCIYNNLKTSWKRLFEVWGNVGYGFFCFPLSSYETPINSASIYAYAHPELTKQFRGNGLRQVIKSICRDRLVMMFYCLDVCEKRRKENIEETWVYDEGLYIWKYLESGSKRVAKDNKVRQCGLDTMVRHWAYEPHVWRIIRSMVDFYSKPTGA